MDEIQINSITTGAQYKHCHVEIDDGHIICWYSKDHHSICGQKINFNLIFFL